MQSMSSKYFKMHLMTRSSLALGLAQSNLFETFQLKCTNLSIPTCPYLELNSVRTIHHVATSMTYLTQLTYGRKEI
jgi:hypothetical protein